MTIRKKHHAATQKLTMIPGVGPSIARDLMAIGIKSVEDLKGKDPEDLYRQANRESGLIQDRCLLYVMRCAVYFAQGGRRPEKLKWWHWKDSAAAQLSNKSGSKKI